MLTVKAKRIINRAAKRVAEGRGSWSVSRVTLVIRAKGGRFKEPTCPLVAADGGTGSFMDWSQRPAPWSVLCAADARAWHDPEVRRYMLERFGLAPATQGKE